MDRQSGQTTKQMMAAPRYSIYIWPNNNLLYPKSLAKKIGRDDLSIVAPSWLDHHWRGTSVEISIDHATWSVMTSQQYRNLDHARYVFQSKAAIEQNK